MKTSTTPPRAAALVDEPASVTAALAMFGGGQTRRVSEEKLAAKQQGALVQDGQDQSRPQQVELPASRPTRRTAGISDPRLVCAEPVGSKHTPTIRAAEQAVQDAASLLNGLFGADLGSRPELLPKVVAAVTEALNGVRQVATLFGSGGAQPGGEVDFQPAFAAFLKGYVALSLSDGASGGSEPAFVNGLALLSKRMTELWGLAPSVLGEQVAARMNAERIPAEAGELAPTRDAAQKLNRFLERDPQHVSAEVQDTLSFLKDVGLRVGWFRDAGKHVLYCEASPKNSKGRSVSPEEVASAVRIAQQHLGIAPLPFVTSRPEPTESRMEEAWGLLHQAFAARDPQSLERWQAASLHLKAPTTGSFEKLGWYLGPHRGLHIEMYSNDEWLAPADRPSFKKGTPEHLAGELRGYLARNGLGDIWVEVTKARRSLTQDHAEAIRDRLEGVRSSPSNPAVGSPEALLRARVGAIKVERDPDSNELEVAVYVPASGTGFYAEPLLQMEEAVRAILSDDASTIGVRIRMKLDPQEDERGYRPQMISVLFGRWTTPEKQARIKAEAEVSDARIAPGLHAYRLDHRSKVLEQFAAGGSIQGELVAQMRHDPNETKGEWKAALTHNLTAWFLGEGVADASWSRRLEQLPFAERSAFLELALAFLEGGAVPPALVEASKTFRRLAGRVELERTSTQNGTLSAAEMAETDAIFKQSLGGPAKDAAFVAIAQARRR